MTMKTGLRPAALLVPVLMALVMAIGLINPLLELRGVADLPRGYHNALAAQAFSSPEAAAFLPILAAIPAAAGYVEDIKSKFVQFFLLRSGYRRYLMHRLLTAAITGGLTGLLGGGLLWGGCALVLLPREGAAVPGISSPLTGLVLLFFCGSLWAVVGLAISAFFESKYIAYASPFIIYYLLVILCERYFPNATLLYPPNWLNGDAGRGAAFLLGLTLLFGLAFAEKAGRRLREL